MLAKRISWIAAVCLAVTSLLPSSGSALTLAELTGTVASSSYTPVTVTSATNKTITITATPQSFANNQWTYQLAWNRTKNAKGSLYVSLKSNSGTKVATVATADQAGSVTFTALPSTAYRVEFYSQPNGKGSLLVRKYFTALSADKAVGAAFSTTNNYSSAGFNNLYGFLSGSANSAGSSNIANSGSFGSGVSAQQIIELIQGGQCNSFTNNCGYDNVVTQMSTKVGPGLVTGTGFNSMSVTRLAYEGSDGKCYFTDLSGTYLLPATSCGGLPHLNATTNPQNAIPDVTTPNFNWGAGGASCGWADKDMNTGAPFFNGAAICGGSQAGGAPVTPAAFCTKYPGDPSCAGQTSGVQNILSFIQGGQCNSFTDNCGHDNAVIQMSTKVGPGLITGTGYNSMSVTRLAYQGSDGKCYFTDLSGTYLLPTTDCGILPHLNATTNPQNAIPAVSTASFNWGFFSSCGWADKDMNTGAPFFNGAAICGGSQAGGAPVTPAAYCVKYPSDPSCNGYVQTAQNILSLIQGGQCNSFTDNCGYDNAVTQMSTKVGPGLVTGTGYNSMSVTRLAYQGSDGKCYFTDLSGTYLLPTANCGNLPHLNATTNPQNAIPAVATPNFNWGAGGASCGWADQYSGTNGPAGVAFFNGAAICGGSQAGGPPVTPATFCVKYPSDPSCSGYNQSAQNILGLIQQGQCNSFTDNCGNDNAVTQMSTKVGPGLVTGTGYNSMSVTRLAYVGSDNKCYFTDLSGTYLLPTSNCGNLPHLNATTNPQNAVPVVTTPNFNWGAGGASCGWADQYSGTNGPAGVAFFNGAAICGGSQAGGPPPTPATFCTMYPNDPSCSPQAFANSPCNGKPYAVAANGDHVCPGSMYCAGTLCSADAFCSTFGKVYTADGSTIINCSQAYNVNSPNYYSTDSATSSSSSGSSSMAGKVCYSSADCGGKNCFGMSLSNNLTLLPGTCGN